jgi:hypothetical protein
MGGGANIFIVAVARASVMKTLKAGDGVQRLAFSSDGTWLAVATFQILPPDEKPGQLIVFDVPALTVKFTAKASRVAEFCDLAWAANGATLCAIEGL